MHVVHCTNHTCMCVMLPVLQNESSYYCYYECRIFNDRHCVVLCVLVSWTSVIVVRSFCLIIVFLCVFLLFVTLSCYSLHERERELFAVVKFNNALFACFCRASLFYTLFYCELVCCLSIYNVNAIINCCWQYAKIYCFDSQKLFLLYFDHLPEVAHHILSACCFSTNFGRIPAEIVQLCIPGGPQKVSLLLFINS